MPEIPKSANDHSADPLPAEAHEREQDLESEVAEFVNRNVLEKDSVFFEG
jgi:hypothetical protein